MLLTFKNAIFFPGISYYKRIGGNVFNLRSTQYTNRFYHRLTSKELPSLVNSILQEHVM